MKFLHALSECLTHFPLYKLGAAPDAGDVWVGQWVGLTKSLPAWSLYSREDKVNSYTDSMVPQAVSVLSEK